MENALIFGLIGNLCLLFALVLQRVLLRHATRERDMYFGLFTAALDALRELDRTAIKRDPKTGRYLKKGR